MKFPYPENLSDWQTAYTRDDAFKEYGKHVKRSELALLAGVLIFSAFIVILVYPKVNLTAFGFYAKLVILLLLVVFVFLLFMIVQSRAVRFAKAFFTDFYQPPEGIDPAKIINYRLHGKFKLPPPFSMLSQFRYIMARDGEIIKSDQWPAWSARNLGGPLLLIVFDGCALYLERGNRFSRIVGPGDKTPFLEWYETIKYVVDLRPKIKEGNFDVWTKDGININLTIQIECRIGDPQKEDPDSNLVYPYDPISVKKAIERHSVRWPSRSEGDPAEFTWIDAAWGQVTGIVPGYIGSRMLDDLFMENRKSGQILSPNAVQEIFDKLNNATRGFGVYITDFQVLEIKLPKEVEEHQKEYWKAERQSIATRIEGEAKAFSIRTREKARADAQYDIILAIAEGLEKHQDGKFTEPLLLSLSRVLDESLSEPLTRAYLAGETLDTLEQLQAMLEKPSS
jgi:regulator of protease activity HflC (stomatin/prohibitin superfamily)